MTYSTAVRLITDVVLDHIRVRYSVGANTYANGDTSEWARRDFVRRAELLLALEIVTGAKQKEMFDESL